jgi:hypothetical protein
MDFFLGYSVQNYSHAIESVLDFETFPMVGTTP